MQIHPLIAIDSYKLGHMVMYPENIANIYVNMTPRSLRHFSKLIPEGFNSRDTLGLAIKATAAWTDKGELIPVQKTVITDPTKVSAIGLLHVDENFNLKVNVTPEKEATGMLKPYTPQPLDFEEIRARARS